MVDVPSPAVKPGLPICLHHTLPGVLADGCAQIGLGVLAEDAAATVGLVAGDDRIACA